MTILQDRMFLLRFACGAFGYRTVADMLARLPEDEAGNGEPGGESVWARALFLNPALASVTPERLAEYDANIAMHSRQLRITREHGRTWKRHQYLALLLTEHYLRRYFDDLRQRCGPI